MANPNSTISWDAVTGAVQYEAGVVASTGNDMNNGGTLLSSGMTASNETSLSAGTAFGTLAAGTYRVQVRALAADPVNNSAWSIPVTVSWDPKLPAPTNVVVT